MSLSVLFVTGSLAPGLDGVGDYVRRLASECASRNVRVAGLAWADGHASDVVEEVNDKFVTLRLPRRISHAVRGDLAKEFVESVDPDILSLQFVPWSYGTRGVARTLGRQLRQVGGTRPWHLMAHELWLDEPRGVKETMLSKVQRAAVLRTLQRLEPAATHASTALNLERLTRAGFAARKLPIFGNIPVFSAPAKAVASDPARVVFFGSPPDRSRWQRLTSELHELSATRTLELVVIGDSGAALNAFVLEIQRSLADSSSSVRPLGHLGDKEVSGWLTNSQAGYTRFAGTHFAKSGSMAAMLEHGLPVWAPHWDGSACDLTFRNGLVHARLAKALQAEKMKFESQLPAVADAFLESANRIANHAGDT